MTDIETPTDTPGTINLFAGVNARFTDGLITPQDKDRELAVKLAFAKVSVSAQEAMVALIAGFIEQEPGVGSMQGIVIEYDHSTFGGEGHYFPQSPPVEPLTE